MRKILAAAMSISLASSPAATAEETRNYISEYAISALGIPVGKTRFGTTIDGNSYTLEGTLRTIGLAQLFAPISGRVAVSGRINGSGLAADVFTMDYTEGKKKQLTEIGFRGTSITRVVNAPEVRKTKDWIETSREHLKDTLDPISATLLRAKTPGEVCRRSIRFFDGAMVADLKLSYLRTVPFYTKGYGGDAVTCRASFVPVAGYPEGKKEVRWMRDKGRIDIAFAPVEGTELYAPVSAKVVTQIGTIRVRATRFEATGP